MTRLEDLKAGEIARIDDKLQGWCAACGCITRFTAHSDKEHSDLDALDTRLDKAGYGTLGKDGKRCRLTF